MFGIKIITEERYCHMEKRIQELERSIEITQLDNHRFGLNAKFLREENEKLREIIKKRIERSAKSNKKSTKK